jgi:hypothetical protein
MPDFGKWLIAGLIVTVGIGVLEGANPVWAYWLVIVILASMFIIKPELGQEIVAIANLALKGR